MQMQRFRPLRTKITMTIMIVVFLSLFCVGAVSLINTNRTIKTMADSNKQMTQTSRSMSSSSMEALTRVRLQELAEDKAALADRTFYEFEQAVSMIASAAEKIYGSRETYPERDVPLPDAEKDGTLSLQLLFASDTDPEDSAVRAEARLLGNIQETLYAINLQNPSIASTYFASASGIMVQADFISAKKFDEAGRIMPLDAKTRAWYQGAQETGRLYLTPVTRDLHTPQLAIMCGVPVYDAGEFKGVAGAGMYLDSINALIESVDLGDKGNICIVNDQGRILFSNFKEGSLSVNEGGNDLRLSADEDLKQLVSNALQGEEGVKQLSLDGAPCYVAYAPMETVGWSVFIILAKDEVDAPTVQLQQGLDRIAEESEASAAERAKKAVFVLLIVFIAALVITLLASMLLSNRVVKPIQSLTDKVSRVGGDDLDFSWEVRSNDETRLLADAFQSLTGRMKEYVSDIQKITAEKERIGTELSLATKIQAGMLPNIFPAFPDRKDFDIYASMTPAKEVGGDFYDFFLIDEEHLALVIADVSGKGVPAALFMMGSMIMIRSGIQNGFSPAQTLTQVNEQICAGNHENMFVTVWLGILDLKSGKLIAANAGHEYPILKQPGEEFELVKDPHGFVLGGLPGRHYKEYEWQLKPGSRLFVYTDGVPEAGDQSLTLFGTDRLLQVLRRTENESPETILEAVAAEVRGYVGDAPQFDDLTMLCLEYKGTDGEENQT